MKFIILALLLVGCTHQPDQRKEVRSLASSEEVIEKLIQNKNLDSYLESLAQVYFRSQFFLYKLDIKLQNTTLGSLVDQEEYQQLVKHRIIKDKIQHEFMYALIALLVIESEETHKDYLVAHEMLDEIRVKWRLIALESGIENKIRKYIMQDILLDTKFKIQNYISLQHAFVPDLNFFRFEEMIKIINTLIFTSKKDQLRLLKELNPILEQKSFKAPANWLETAVAEIHLEENFPLETQPKKRDIQSLDSNLVCPSLNETGNINGSRFPKGVWALTFDDGPERIYTAAIQNILNQNNVKGSFFWLSELTPHSSELVMDLKKDGHTLANHSATHPLLTSLNEKELRKEIIESNQIHKQFFGFTPKFFRCPYGACGKNDSAIRRMIDQQKMVHVFWNVDSLDWQDRNPDSILTRVQGQFNRVKDRSGGIILFHDIHPQSVEAVKRLVPWLKAQGVQLKSLEEIIKLKNAGRDCQSGWTPFSVDDMSQ